MEGSNQREIALFESLGLQLKDSSAIESEVIQRQRLQHSKPAPLIPPTKGRAHFGLPAPVACVNAMFGSGPTVEENQIRKTLVSVQHRVNELQERLVRNQKVSRHDLLTAQLEEELLTALLTGVQEGPEITSGVQISSGVQEEQLAKDSSPSPRHDSPKKRKAAVPANESMSSIEPASKRKAVIARPAVIVDDVTEERAECPICGQRVISLTGDESVDQTAIARHVERCMNGRQRALPPRRSTRQAVTEIEPAEEEQERDPDFAFEDDEDDEFDVPSSPPTRRTRSAGPPTPTGLLSDGDDVIETGDRTRVRGQVLIDDVTERAYHARLEDWRESHSDDDPGVSSFTVEEGEQVELPASLSQGLLGYQKDGIKWLWGLYKQGAGGILGDEMGLGKTVQISAYLELRARRGDLSLSSDGPALIVCPATMIHHWLRELHQWAPSLRVIVLHQSSRAFRQSANKQRFMRRWTTFNKDESVSSPVAMVATYESLRREPHRNILLSADWGAAILDEGQRIRNPDAEISTLCKQLRTVNRIVLSGTPIQNALRELWSLFDFVFPGRLGTLASFEDEFAAPIRAGGYANASPAQVHRARRMASTLKALISPYLLRRLKSQVMVIGSATSQEDSETDTLHRLATLPEKTEQVLFCKLTVTQRRLYERLLASDEMQAVFDGRARSFRLITILRKLCNHADLLTESPITSASDMDRLVKQSMVAAGPKRDDDDDDDAPQEEEYGHPDRSGKLQVLAKVMPLWRAQGHRVLLFCQTRQMLSIVERWLRTLHAVKDEDPFTYVRMDGNTSLGSRQSIVDRFNSDDSIFAALLTTRVGGIGVNLTGADRVVLVDPDWNPQTDVQARERAWRLGQTRPVTIYRLITAGTIEEKVYHRQIFKSQISGNVLQSGESDGFAATNRIFTQHELKELFTLKVDETDDSLTSDILPHGSVQKPSPSSARRVVRPKGGADSWRSDVSRRRRLLQQARTTAEKRGENDHSMDESAVLKSLWDASIKGAFNHDVLDRALSDRERSMVNERKEDLKAQRLAGLAAARFRRRSSNSSAPPPPPPPPTTTTTTTAAQPAEAQVAPVIASAQSQQQSQQQSQRRFGSQVSRSSALSSQSLLASLSRQDTPGAGAVETPDDAGERARSLQWCESMVHRITMYLRGKRGARTQKVLDRFSSVTDENALLFKSCLKAVAECEKGRWFLKEPFLPEDKPEHTD